MLAENIIHWRQHWSSSHRRQGYTREMDWILKIPLQLPARDPNILLGDKKWSCRPSSLMRKGWIEHTQPEGKEIPWDQQCLDQQCTQVGWGKKPSTYHVVLQNLGKQKVAQKLMQWLFILLREN